MTTEKKIKPLLDKVVEIIRHNSFTPEYQPKATIEECLGIAVSKYFEWDTRIFIAFYEALEDANFHTAAEEMRKIAERVNKQYSRSYFPKK
jgi:hypothetical protein